MSTCISTLMTCLILILTAIETAAAADKLYAVTIAKH